MATSQLALGYMLGHLSIRQYSLINLISSENLFGADNQQETDSFLISEDYLSNQLIRLKLKNDEGSSETIRQAAHTLELKI